MLNWPLLSMLVFGWRFLARFKASRPRHTFVFLYNTVLVSASLKSEHTTGLSLMISPLFCCLVPTSVGTSHHVQTLFHRAFVKFAECLWCWGIWRASVGHVVSMLKRTFSVRQMPLKCDTNHRLVFTFHKKRFSLARARSLEKAFCIIKRQWPESPFVHWSFCIVSGQWSFWE